MSVRSALLFFIFTFYVKHLLSYDYLNMGFLTYKSEFSGNHYYIYGISIKIDSLNEAMSLCPNGSRLLTLQTDDIKKDISKIQNDLEERVLLSMATKHENTSWIYNEKLCLYFYYYN